MRDRYPPAFAVFFAAAMYTLGSAAYILGKLEILPNSTLLENALAFGLLLQVMLFAFALSIRIGMERQLREEAQIETAHAKDMLLETERQQNIHLDKVVRSRTKQLEEVNERLQKISATDALTGLYNRRYFDESLKREYARAARNKAPLSVMMIDLDRFKSINDNYGHVFGDEALRQTALRMQDVLKRPGDVAFRYGGEEYVILLPDTNTSAARIIAKQIWSAMRSSQIFHDDQSETITVSIGIATVVPSPNGDPNKLLRDADHKLYRAKEEGRDRICV
jgi:diguanylate cyclase